VINILSFGNAILTILGMVIVFIGKNYVLPFLKVEKRRRYAKWIAHLADEISDDLLARYPEDSWIKFVDESVDKLMEVCGIDKDVAGRAINSALHRKISTPGR
jgi:hypothetical protein